MDKSLPEAPKKYRFGICAMTKKVEASPMKMLIERIQPYFEIVIFPQDMILNDPIESWPIVDVLMGWYSDGYPLDKAIAYVDYRKPYALNDLRMQKISFLFLSYNLFFDRRIIHKMLKDNGIKVPDYILVERDEEGNVIGDFEEHEEYIVLDGKKLEKPFVEKPVNAEDHRVRIYYSRVDGGGMKELFRKSCNQCSHYYPDVSHIRTDGSYIYERFLQTEGTDVKVYSVGVSYVHAEARKSPTVDGRVDRDKNGKEVRYPILLTYDEKQICRKIATMFKQTICGFDLLRDRGTSYICDVNGVSFVKKNAKFWDDAAHLITLTVYKNLCPEILRKIDTEELEMSTREKQQLEDEKHDHPVKKDNEEHLRAVICVCRHGDRTPKQKLKFKVSNESLISKIKPLIKDPRKEVKIKEASQMNHIVSVVTNQIHEMQSVPTNKMEDLTDDMKLDDNTVLKNRLLQLVAVMQQGGQFKGFNRKIQIRTLKWNVKNEEDIEQEVSQLKMNISAISSPVIQGSTNDPADPLLKQNTLPPLLLDPSISDPIPIVNSIQAEQLATTSIIDPSSDPVLLPGAEESHFELRQGVERSIEKQDKCNQNLPRIPSTSSTSSYEDDIPIRNKDYNIHEIMFIVKWGGVLTPTGRKQAITLGEHFRRCMYGGDAFFLRMHNTYRHDMKIYSSEEGRVRTTAAAFAKGCLDVEGEHLTPIMVSMVHCHRQADYMLDNTSKAMEMLVNVKSNLYSTLMEKGDMTEERMKRICPAGNKSVLNALSKIGNAYDFLMNIYNEIKALTNSLIEYGLTAEGAVATGYEEETISLALGRWRKLQKDFYDKQNDTFDLSKIPTLYDCIKFDYIHNKSIPLAMKDELFRNSKIMADIIVPQEYGMYTWEKMLIGRNIVKNLLIKIDVDLRISAYGPTSKFIEKSDHLQEVSSYKADERYTEEDIVSNKTVYTRMYFTSESHIHGILNVLRYGSSSTGLHAVTDEGLKALDEVPEYDYLSYILLRLFENDTYDMNDPRRFRVELSFSPGCVINMDDCLEEPVCQPSIILHDKLTLQDLQSILSHVLNDDDQKVKDSYADTLNSDRSTPK